MPTASPPLPPLPPHDQPLVDRDGKINEFWWNWLRAVELVLRQVRSEIP